MQIGTANYLGSWQKCDEMPQKNMPEFAFIGRSNVGKSSLINMLCDRKALAKTSSTPGKTQSLNLFDINKKMLFCDLPGYGYARVSKTQRATFSKMIHHYLQKRENLTCLFILIDLRIPPQTSDIEFVNTCGEGGIPLAIIGTKCDKMGKEKLQSSIEHIKTELYKTWENLPPFFISSSEAKIGRTEIWEFINTYA